MSLETSSDLTAEQEAQVLINHSIEEKTEGTTSAEAVKQAVTQNIHSVSADARHYMQTYVNAVGPATQGMKVEELEEGVGGQYDGAHATIAAQTLYVSGSIEETIAKVKEVGRHEDYHKDNKHLEQINSADGSSELRLAGYSFDVRAAVEGLTVHDTGNRFVSAEYQQFEQRIVSAANQAGVGIEGVRSAINDKKDFTLIDDRTRVMTGSAAGTLPASSNPL